LGAALSSKGSAHVVVGEGLSELLITVSEGALVTVATEATIEVLALGCLEVGSWVSIHGSWVLALAIATSSISTSAGESSILTTSVAATATSRNIAARSTTVVHKWSRSIWLRLLRIAWVSTFVLLKSLQNLWGNRVVDISELLLTMSE